MREKPRLKQQSRTDPPENHLRHKRRTKEPFIRSKLTSLPRNLEEQRFSQVASRGFRNCGRETTRTLLRKAHPLIDFRRCNVLRKASSRTLNDALFLSTSVTNSLIASIVHESSNRHVELRTW